jgi:hypothetical protein
LLAVLLLLIDQCSNALLELSASSPGGAVMVMV